MSALLPYRQNCQKSDTGKSQDPGNEDGHRIHGKGNACKGGYGIQKPQAHKAAAGMEGKLQNPFYRQQQQPYQNQCHQCGDQQGDAFFHKIPPDKGWLLVHTSSGQTEISRIPCLKSAKPCARA